MGSGVSRPVPHSSVNNPNGQSRTGQDTTNSSPQVFISYQWKKQPQIKSLYKRLTDLGYTCWLDVEQMGGGNILNEELDRGISGCKVVLACVTPEYATSRNCRNEVCLSEARKKPIIPLMLEKVKWPPEGTMAFTFAPLLYIDFCKTNNGVQSPWSGPQFDQLIQQLGQRGILKNKPQPASSISDLPEKLPVKSSDSAIGTTRTNSSALNNSAALPRSQNAKTTDGQSGANTKVLKAGVSGDKNSTSVQSRTVTEEYTPHPDKVYTGVIKKQPPESFKPVPVLELADILKSIKPTLTPRPFKDSSIFKNVDSHAFEVSKVAHTSFRQLIWHLIYARQITNEVEKARAILLWLCTKDFGSLKFSNVEKGSPDEILMNIHEKRTSYAVAFELLCRHAGLQCKTISGYAKGGVYRPGMKLTEEFRHHWNAVNVNGEWRLVDCK